MPRGLVMLAHAVVLAYLAATACGVSPTPLRETPIALVAGPWVRPIQRRPAQAQQGASTIQRNNAHGSIMSAPPRPGILIVGLGGGNGVTAVAGFLANRDKLKWEGPMGRVSANYLGCITQQPSRGGTGGYRERCALADANRLAFGGWDIRSTPLGDALYEARILDYDLVRQVREEMNGLPVMAGVWDPDFIGESQHASATHVAGAGESQQRRLDRIREDIRRFREGEAVTGHVTVVWSASVERPSERNFEDPEQLLGAIAADDREVSPSILYATAAVLEGCSFVNGGSQNTLCGALLKLAEERGCYVLGTDFKAGQTKFKTAAVEYIRHLGLRPKVIASSNHLGNNDMLNLTTKKTLGAKMRVKSDIFAPWDEEINHEVRVMYTPLIGDEKRDVVEYTSLGFLNCAHTMLTYTRAMDSALCVPLMIDAAVWCDHFRRINTPPEAVARATAYLFKVPEGGARGVDPGFFRQMRALEDTLVATAPPAGDGGEVGSGGGGVQARAAAAEAAAEAEAKAEAGAGAPAPPPAPAPALASSPPPPSPSSSSSSSSCLAGRVVCVGISCLDLQLVEATRRPGSDEVINTFREARYCPGGSCPQTSTALADLGVKGVAAVTKMGVDAHGKEMVEQMEAAGVDCRLVIRDAKVQTALAVLPIFAGGGRGCFVNLAANEHFLPAEITAALRTLAASASAPPPPAARSGPAGPGAAAGGEQEQGGAPPSSSFAAFHLGYPHFLPRVQGADLAELLAEARRALPGGPLVSLDLNGVEPPDAELGAAGVEACRARHEAVLGPAVLAGVDLLHANLEEAEAIAGMPRPAVAAAEPGAGAAAALEEHARALARWFLARGVAVMAVTLGGRGSLVEVTGDAVRLAASPGLQGQAAAWAGLEARQPAFAAGEGGEVNANGAGDAFVGGLVAAMAWRRDETVTLGEAARFAALVALQRVDGRLREAWPKAGARELMARAKAGAGARGLPPTLPVDKGPC